MTRGVGRMTRGGGRKTGGVQNDGKGDNVAGPCGRMVRPSMASAFVVVRPSVASTPVVVRPSMASTPVHRRTDGQTDRRTVRELLNPPLLSFFAIADNLVWNDKRRGVRFFIHHSSFFILHFFVMLSEAKHLYTATVFRLRNWTDFLNEERKMQNEESSSHASL